MQDNIQLVNNLYKLLYSKESYVKYLESNGGWWFMSNYPDHFLKYSFQLNTLMEEKYKFGLLPVIKASYSDDVLCIFDSKYYLIHNYCDIPYELRGIYETPEEVWENLVKSDVEPIVE